MSGLALCANSPVGWTSVVYVGLSVGFHFGSNKNALHDKSTITIDNYLYYVPRSICSLIYDIFDSKANRIPLISIVYNNYCA